MEPDHCVRVILDHKSLLALRLQPLCQGSVGIINRRAPMVKGGMPSP